MMSYVATPWLRDRRWRLAIVLLGLIVSVLMVSRSQVAGDQLNLLGLGWQLAFEGDWVQHGAPTSAGGFTPGGMTGLVVGAPLWLWTHHRSAALVVLLGHLVAFGILDRLLRGILTAEERTLFAVLYWLNPWRLYHSAFLWNANYLFLIGALHLWTAWRARERPSFWASFGHVLALGLGAQIAVHTALLMLCTLAFWYRGYMRLHLGGAAAAAAVVVGSLVPWAAAVAADPTLLPDGGDGRWFFLLNTSLRAAIYWMRYASFAVSGELRALDLGEVIGSATQDRIEPTFDLVLGVLYLGSLAVSGWANYRLWRGAGRWWRPATDCVRSDRDWLRGVVRWAFLVVLTIFALHPTTVSRWYLFGVFHLAVLPLVLAAGELLRDPMRAPRVRRAAGAWAWISAALAVLLVVGGPMYRCSGDQGSSAASLPDLRHDHPMLDTLGINATCPVTVNDPDGWWMPTVPEPQPCDSFAPSTKPSQEGVAGP